MATKRGYITTAKYTEITNRSLSNTAEWERQLNRAEEYVDLISGFWPKFHLPSTINSPTATSSTIAGSFLSSNKDDYYNNLRIRVVQGTGSGYEGRITDYNGSTGVATVSGSFSSTPDSTSTIVIEQDAVFPRLQDMDIDGRPRVPDYVTLAVAYIVEYWDIKGGDGGINADVMNDTGGKESESIEGYSVAYRTSREIREIIGNKAYEVLARSGLIRTAAKMVRWTEPYYGWRR